MGYIAPFLDFKIARHKYTLLLVGVFSKSFLMEYHFFFKYTHISQANMKNKNSFKYGQNYLSEDLIIWPTKIVSQTSYI